MYCNHDYLSPRVGTLDPLRGDCACVREFNVTGWIFLAHLPPPLCLHDLCIRAPPPGGGATRLLYCNSSNICTEEY